MELFWLEMVIEGGEQKEESKKYMTSVSQLFSKISTLLKSSSFPIPHKHLYSHI
jgi:hypothetical protein